MPVVLKIDTQTGQTWELMNIGVHAPGTTGVTPVKGWTPVPEDVIDGLLRLKGRVGATNAPPLKK